MQKERKKDLEKVLAAKRRRKIWAKVAGGLMAVAVFCTTYALILPAITESHRAYCSIEEHTHQSSCYSEGTIEQAALICQPESEVDFVLHEHDEMCYDDANELICSLTPRQEHTHGPQCYDDNGEKSCEKPEIQEHIHSADCMTEENVPACGLPEIVKHQHDDSCRAVVTETVQLCEPGALAHVHDELCYDAQGRLLCTMTELEGHTHSDLCYTVDTVLTCDEEENEEHTHTQECYTDTETLSCGEEELDSHQHTQSCFGEIPVRKTAMVLSCTQQEHTHEESCFEKPDSLQFTYTDDLLSGMITLTWNDDLPDDLKCTVIALDEQTQEYENMLESVDEALLEDSMSRLDIQLYELRWESQGEEYTLPDGIEPVVELKLLESFDTSSGASLTGLLLSQIDDGAVRGTGQEAENIEQAISDENQTEEIDVPEENGTDESSSYIKKSPRKAAALDTQDSEISDQSTDETAYDVTLVVVQDDTISVNLMNNSTFGVAALSKSVTVSGGYYRRINSVSELQSLTFSDSYSAKSVSGYNKFVFVFTNGMYALEGTTVDDDDTSNGLSGHLYDNVFYPTFRLHKVEVQQIAANTNYVTIKDVGTGTEYSPSSMATQNYIIQSPHPNYSSSGVYLLRELGANNKAWMYLRSGTYGRTGGNWSNGIRFEYDSERGTFHMYTEENGYLSTNIEPDANAYNGYSESDTLGSLDAVALKTNNETATVVVEDEILDYANGYQVNNSEMLIYVYEETTLTIPSVDMTNQGQTLLPRATQPTYSAQTEKVSKAESGTDEDSGYRYASDEATSQIELLLGASQYPSSYTQEQIYAAQQENDGRIVTDKTVIYAGDDYGAFDSYASDEFSVTLSALGQEWTVSDETDIESPIDVIFLLDLSGSMTDVASTTDTTTQRWQAVLSATNKAMSYVLNSNPGNRVGVVCFSNTAYTLLPLGSYALVDGYKTAYSNYTDGYISYDTTAASSSGWTQYDAWRSTVGTHPALAVKNETTGAYQYYNNGSRSMAWVDGMWSATYTQMGLQQVYNEFAKASTTYTETVDGKTVSVQRKPVIIMLSDGEPTQGTFNYMDPVSGPKYGVGTVAENGMLGYYTILSANYFKNMTSIHYGINAAFYTIGVGIKPTGSGSYSVEASASQTTTYLADDSYRRAVLDPSNANVNYLVSPGGNYSYSNSDTNYKLTRAYYTASVLLYDLLEGGNTSSYIQNLESFHADEVNWKAYTTFELWMRAISNPFSNYDYADDSMFYGDFTEKQLEECFENIVETVQMINNYGFLLKDHSSVTITDPIGQGMEVKGTPVLSYFGTLYRNPTMTESTDYVEYTWSAKATRQSSDSKGSNVKLDLSVIKARVYTDPDGNQTVEFIIPENVMPTLYPDLHKTFYYEELPVRLIYKVGLRADATASMELGESKTYYTNAFSQGDTSAVAETTVSFTPEENNPYYFGQTSTYSDQRKNENTTDTADYVFSESVGYGTVKQSLGNNGLLTVSKTDALTIIKSWDGVSQTDRKPVTLWLFREKQYIDDDGLVTGVGSIESYGTQSLSAENGWRVTLKSQEYSGRDDTGNYLWQYYVTEDVATMGIYRAYYTDGSGNIMDYVTRDVTAPGGYAYYGIRLYPLSGCVIINNHSGKLTVTKNWNDSDPGADSVTVYIYKRTTPIYGGSLTPARTELFQTVTLSDENDWTYTYDYAYTYGIDFTTIEGCYFDYFVTEEPIDGYAATYSYSSGHSLSAEKLTVSNGETIAYPALRDVTITNSPNGMTSITVKKTWGAGTDPEPVRVVLYAWGTRTDKETGKENPYPFMVLPNDHPDAPLALVYVEDAVITLNESNNWTYTWTNLPLFKEDDETTMRMDYYLYEVDQDGYIVTYFDKDGQTIETTECEIEYVKGSASRFGTTIQAAHVSGGQVTIQNNAPATLPHTGGVGNRMFYVMGLGIMFLTGSVLLVRRKRKTN